MRAAVLSDIHANLPALDAVLDHITEQGGVDTYLFCGDLVGYYCWPNEVIDRAREHEFLGVRGNHDEAIIQGSAFGFEGAAGTVLNWAMNALTTDAKAFLSTLPYSRRETIGGNDTYVVHGSPRAPVAEYVYPEQVRDEFFTEQGVTTVPDMLLLGHTHVPFNARVNDTLVMNPGSVGQPRDGNPDASYAIVDVETGGVEHHRVTYDIDRVVERVQDEDLPPQVGERLRTGR